MEAGILRLTGWQSDYASDEVFEDDIALQYPELIPDETMEHIVVKDSTEERVKVEFGETWELNIKTLVWTHQMTR